MKKVFSAFLALMILTMCFGAFADDVYEKPILFRNIEWGSSLNTALKEIPNGVKMRDFDEREYWYPVSDFIYDGNGYGTQLKANLGGYVYARSSSMEGVKVAGYDVKNIYMYFLYEVGEDGLLKKDTDNTSFVYAYYLIEPKDSEAVFNDLTAKLTSIYGDVDITKSDSSIISYWQNAWNGADGTVVSLVREDYSSGTHNIYIKYATRNADTLMREAYDAIVLEETQNAASDISGL